MMSDEDSEVPFPSVPEIDWYILCVRLPFPKGWQGRNRPPTSQTQAKRLTCDDDWNEMKQGRQQAGRGGRAVSASQRF